MRHHHTHRTDTQMSRSVRQAYPPIIMYPCYECATITTNLPDASGVALCDRHKTGELLFCDEVNSEFRREK